MNFFNLFSVKSALAQSFFGRIAPPPGVSAYGGTRGEGLLKFFSNLLRMLIIGAGLIALFNFVMAGYGFMSAGGDAKKINEAWAKIWQSMVGLLVAAGSFTLASVISKLIFGSWSTILSPPIYEPY